MSRADLHPRVSCEFDMIRRGWLVWVPLYVIEENAHRMGHRFIGDMGSTSGAAEIGKQITEIIAMAGPIQRAVRAQVKKNNSRRFGP